MHSHFITEGLAFSPIHFPLYMAFITDTIHSSTPKHLNAYQALRFNLIYFNLI